MYCFTSDDWVGASGPLKALICPPLLLNVGLHVLLADYTLLLMAQAFGGLFLCKAICPICAPSALSYQRLMLWGGGIERPTCK